MIDPKYKDNGFPEKMAFIAGDFMYRFTTGLMMAQGRAVADRARDVSTFEDGTGDLRASIVAIPLKKNMGIKVTSRHNGRYLPHASPMGMGIDITPRNGEFITFWYGDPENPQWVKFRRITYGPKLNIRGPFREIFGSGRGFRIVEERMAERIQEMISK